MQRLRLGSAELSEKPKRSIRPRKLDTDAWAKTVLKHARRNAVVAMPGKSRVLYASYHLVCGRVLRKSAGMVKTRLHMRSVLRKSPTQRLGLPIRKLERRQGAALKQAVGALCCYINLMPF